MSTGRRYEYSSGLKFVYLWLPYVLAIGMSLCYVWTARLFLPRFSLLVAIALALPPALGVSYYLLAHYAKTRPVAIEISDGRVSLYRFEKYLEFPIEDVRRVARPFWNGGWVDVQFALGARVARFAFGPELPGFRELVDTLRQGGVGEGADDA